jgi:hypothetical protein
MMYGCSQGEYMMAKTTPISDVVDNYDDYYTAQRHILPLERQ